MFRVFDSFEFVIVELEISTQFTTLHLKDVGTHFKTYYGNKFQFFPSEIHKRNLQYRQKNNDRPRFIFLLSSIKKFKLQIKPRLFLIE
jgi:hypothetical protein